VALGFGSPRSWRFFARYFGPHKAALIGNALFSVLVSLAAMPVLLLVRLAFDHAIPEKNVQLLIGIGVAIVAIRIASSIAAMATRRHAVRVIKDVIAGMRGDLVASLCTTDRADLAQQDADRLQNRIVQDSERVDVLMTSFWSSWLPALVMTAALSALMLYFSWTMTLLATVAAPTVVLVARLTQARVSRDVRAFQADFQRFNRGVSFVLRQMDLIRSQGFRRQEVEKQRAIAGDLSRSGQLMNWSFAVHGQAQGTVIGVIGIGLLVIGGFEVMRGVMSIGEFVAFYLGAGLMSGALTTVMKGTADIVAGAVSFDALAEIAEPGRPLHYGGVKRLETVGRLSLRDVSFSYRDAPILAGVNLDIVRGEQIAILGPNGAGKSTLLNVILGITRPISGSVRADDVAYGELDLEALRCQFGVVMQRAGFFHGTIRANMTYGVPDASLDDIKAAAQLAGAAQFIEALPQAYDSLVGDSGVSLSGGECQRLALARALLRKPSILILDEPTNHLDTAAVSHVLDVLRDLPGSPAIIVVSHDPRVTAFVGRTWYLEAGVLSEQRRESGHG
jgi:ABC-type bacteriocin/lantibiotic exporter with double-glycine peptidase domain